MSSKDIVKREVELACKDADGYTRACINSAYKAYLSLADDGHSGYSIGATASILTAMIEGKPLTPLLGDDNEWNPPTDPDFDRENGFVSQTNKRYGPLVKYTHNDGTVSYRDIDVVRYKDVDNCGLWCCGGLWEYVKHVIPEVEFPYSPFTKPYVVSRQDFLYDKENGDYDTVWLMFATSPSGETIEINKFLKESWDGFEEITMEEYMERKANKYDPTKE